MSSHRWLVWIITVYCAGILLFAPAASTSETAGETPRAYSPFDEPRPKIPQEIIDDKRLDQHVKVFVKSMNIKQLFAALTEKTGVKITAAHELHGERPIIYFHKRPLRDVMTEVSGLYGYHWLISGKPGAYEYELFEDIRHAKRRDEAMQEVKAEQDAILLDLAKMCIEDDKILDRLAEADTTFYMKVFLPHLRETSKLFSRMGIGFLSSVLAAGRIKCLVSDLSPEYQQAVCDWDNAARQRRAAHLSELGLEPSDTTLVTPADLASTTFSIRRGAGTSGMPFFGLNVTTPLPDGGSLVRTFPWPYRRLSEDKARELTGREVPKKVLGTNPLPDEPKITVEKLRLVKFSRVLPIGDACEAIARQSDFDVLADYHFRDETMEAFKAVPLRQVVDNVCDTFLYTCQVSGHTLRFRFNKWFAEPLLVEPPAKLIERLWTIVEREGRLDMRDLGQFAPLTDEQIKWPGFKWMPGADAAAERGAIIRLWATLSDAELAVAGSDAGLPLSQLSPVQRERLDKWAAAINVEASEDEVDRSVVRTYTSELDYGWPEDGTGRNLVLELPDGKRHQQSVDLPPPLKPEERKEVAAQRKADAEADVIEVLQ